MVEQLVIGTIVISLTIVIQSLFVGGIIVTLTRFGSTLSRPPYLVKTIASLTTVVLLLIVGITINVWLWAATFLILDVFQTLEPALYFSTVTFTTLGFGDITLDQDWRILSSLTAVNGLIIFGLNTAFIVEFLSKLKDTQATD